MRRAQEVVSAPSVALATTLGLALLLSRRILVGQPDRVPALLAVYVVLLFVSLAAPQASVLEAPALSPAAGLLLGMAAIGAAAAMAGPSFPIRISPATIPLGTVAAVAEEAFFRRLLYGALAGNGTAAAIGGSALVFAAVHVPIYGWAAFPVNLGAGLLFAWQRWATGRWSVPAATHAAANLLAVLP